MAESTTSASGLSGALSTIGNTVSSVVGGVGDLLGYVPVVGGLLDSGVDALGNVAGSLLSLGQMKTPAAASSTLPAVGLGAATKYSDTATRLSEIASANSGVSLTSGQSTGVVFKSGLRDTKTETDFDFAERSATDAEAFLSSAVPAIPASKVGAASYSVDKLNSLIRDELPVVKASGDPAAARAFARDVRAQASLVASFTVPDRDPNISALETAHNLYSEEVASGDIGFDKLPSNAVTDKSPVKNKFNASVDRLERDTAAAFAKYKEVAAMPEGTAKSEAAAALAVKFNTLNNQKNNLTDEYAVLSNKEFTNGWKKYNWAGDELGVDWTAVTGMMSVLSPLAIAGISYYQAEKTAKRAHKWAVEDREDTQAFTASESAAARASNEAIAATESEDDSSGSVGASSAGSIGGSIASA